jgi:cell wall-associated NlpC family hydrolase
LEEEETEGSDMFPPGSVGAELREHGIRWGYAFASAAKEFHDGWPYGLFLSVLLAICDKETGFRNVRGGGNVEWYPRPVGGRESPGGPARGDVGSLDAAVAKWRREFANERRNPLNPRYPSSNSAVGPMQLVTDQYVDWADAYGGKQDEYEGGRWVPQANIRAGGRAFAQKLSGLDPKSRDPERSNIWIGVELYYGHPDPSQRRAYMLDVRRRWQQKYRQFVETSAEPVQDPAPGEGRAFNVKDANGNPFTVHLPSDAPPTIKKVVVYCLNQLGKPYRWGAEGPGSFDCSGLIYAAFRNAGYTNITRTTYTMWGQGFRRVAKDALRIGDLVFFNDLSHMGMYIGNNHFIQAPRTGDVVKISALRGWYADSYYGARRVIAWPRDQGRESPGGPDR